MRLRASALALALAVTTVLAQTPAAVPTSAKSRGEQLKLRTLRGPLKITAERADLDRREYALYRGNVRLTSAELELTGERLELRQPAKGQFTARLTGAPAHLRHEAMADAPALAASAQQIDYDTRSSLIEMSGGAEVERGSDHISSDTIRYNVAARRISATGAGRRQVQIVVQPGQNKGEGDKKR